MKSKPETKKVKAIDVIPFRWALWCTIEDGEPFLNVIVARRWFEPDEPGPARIGFMLDSHNFLIAFADEKLELVPYVEKHRRSRLSNPEDPLSPWAEDDSDEAERRAQKEFEAQRPPLVVGEW